MWQCCIFIVCSITIFGGCQQLTEAEKEGLRSIRRSIDDPPAEAWIYRYDYASLSSMLITEDILDNAKICDGENTRNAMKNQVRKAMRGEDVDVYIFGESVSLGAELGRANKQLVFHYALAVWWNNTIGKATGSFMRRRNIAIGGVMTKYFSKCWKEYMKSNETFDLAIWEFNINDRKDENLPASIEYFTRSIYERYQSLDLMFVIFYSRDLFQSKRNELLQKRHDLSEDVVARHGRYYDLTTFNIEKFVNDSRYSLNPTNLFNNIHPSELAHAQMAILLMRYYTEVIREIITGWLKVAPKPLKTITLPPPMYISINTKFNAICWTATLVNVKDYDKLQHPLFYLTANGTQDVTAVMDTMEGKEEREDVLGGYFIKEGGGITLQISVPANRSECNIAIANRMNKQSNQARTVFFGENSKLYIESSISASGRLRAQYVDSVATAPPGDWLLSIYALRGNFLLNAVLIC